MMTKHTPGPWVVKSARSGFYVESQFDVIVDSLDESGRYGAIDSEANARLIAAAPELLEALSCLTAVLALKPKELSLQAIQEAYDMARAAIAKAEGETAMNETQWTLADIEADLQMPTAVLREIIRQCKEAKDQRDELLSALELVAGLYGVATSDCRYIRHLEVAAQAFYMASIARAAIAKAEGSTHETP